MPSNKENFSCSYTINWKKSRFKKKSHTTPNSGQFGAYWTEIGFSHTDGQKYKLKWHFLVEGGR